MRGVGGTTGTKPDTPDPHLLHGFDQNVLREGGGYRRRRFDGQGLRRDRAEHDVEGRGSAAGGCGVEGGCV